jgi:large subunit ribosomal protein L30
VAKMKITLVKSCNGYGPDQEDTLKALGLRRIRQSVIREDIPTVRGQVMKVKHLVTVEEA